MTTLETGPGERQRASRLPLMVLGVVVLSWGAGPVITKLITAPPVVGVIVRFGLSVPVLFGLVALRGGKVSMATFRKASLPGLAFGVNLIFVFAAVQEATIAVIAVSVALQPALLLFVAGPLFGERPTMAHVMWTCLGVVGAAVVILGAGDELRASGLGILFSVLALLTFSVYFVLTRLARSTVDVDPVEWMAAINVWSLVAALIPAPFLIGPGDIGQLDWTDLWWLVVLAYLTGVLGHVLMSWVHGYIEAARSALYLLSMNLVAVSLAWPVHDEPVTLLQLLGGLVVLVSVASVIRLPPRVDPRPAN